MRHGTSRIEPTRATPMEALEAETRTVHAAQQVVLDLFGPPSAREFAVRYWDGTTERPAGHPPFTLDIRGPSSLRRMLLPPTELSIAEAYVLGDLDVGRIGSVRGAVSLLRHVLALPAADHSDRTGTAPDTHAARWMIRFGREHSADRDAHAVRFHY